ncbi:hypothetical protein MRX96_025005 [Rhipicephalus microplus]
MASRRLPCTIARKHRKGGLLRNDSVGAAAKQGVLLTPACSSGADLWRRQGGFSSTLDAAPSQVSKRASRTLCGVTCARAGKKKTRRNTKTLACGGRTWCNRGFAEQRYVLLFGAFCL